MAFTTGTATDYYDLLDKLRLYLIAQGWTVNNWIAGGVLAQAQLDVAAPGSVGGEQPKISIRTGWNIAANSYGWELCAYPNYNPASEFGLQEQNSPSTWLCLWQNTLDYWFYVNDRRFIVVANIGTFYMSAYAGFFLPYALPAEYPFPYFVGATFPTLQPYNLNNSAMRSFCDPGISAASYQRRESMEWALLKNVNSVGNGVDSYSTYDGPVIWPYRTCHADNNTFDNAASLEWSFFHRMRPLANGKMPLWQCTIVDSWDETVPGVLDGVFATGGFNRVPEQIVTVDAQDYRLFIAAGKDSPKHYFAIEEV